MLALCYALISADGAAQAQQAVAATPTPPVAQDGGGVGGASGLAKPTGIEGVGAIGSIRLDWGDGGGAAEYEVQQWDGHVSPARVTHAAVHGQSRFQYQIQRLKRGGERADKRHGLRS